MLQWVVKNPGPLGSPRTANKGSTHLAQSLEIRPADEGTDRRNRDMTFSPGRADRIHAFVTNGGFEVRTVIASEARTVIASEAKQSRSKRRLDCFVASLLAMTVSKTIRDRSARRPANPLIRHRRRFPRPEYSTHRRRRGTALSWQPPRLRRAVPA